MLNPLENFVTLPYCQFFHVYKLKKKIFFLKQNCKKLLKNEIQFCVFEWKEKIYKLFVDGIK